MKIIKKNTPRKNVGYFFVAGVISIALVVVIILQLQIIFADNQAKTVDEFHGVNFERLENSGLEHIDSIPNSISADQYARTLYELTNGIRLQQTSAHIADLPSYTWDQCAADVAKHRAKAQATLYENLGDLSNIADEDLPAMQHASLDEDMKTCGASTAGENLSRKNDTPLGIAKAWVKSSGHYANLVSRDFSRLGIACVPFRAYYLCSQVFF